METKPLQEPSLEVDEQFYTDRGLLKKFMGAFKRKTLKFGESAASIGPSEDTIGRVASRISNLTGQLTTIDMPDDKELNDMFKEVMLDAGMPKERLDDEFLAGRSRDDKWNFVRNSGKLHEMKQAKYTPEYFLSLLHDQADAVPVVEKVNPELLKKETASCLRIQLTNQSIT